MQQPSTLPVRPTTSGMRAILLIGSFFVFVAGIQLFVLTEYTQDFFAWTIRPPLTAAFLGAFYWTACTLALTSARQPVWANARVGVPGVLVFVTLTLVATLLHVDRFHLSNVPLLSQVAAWAWLAIYVLEPPALLVLLILQLRAPGVDPPRTALLPGWFRLVKVVQAGVVLIGGILLFFLPSVSPSVWAWELTPLTARAVGSWLIAFGIVLAQEAWENDWERVRRANIAWVVLGVLQLAALGRFAGSVSWGTPQMWVYLLLVLSVLAIGLYGVLAASRTQRAVLGSLSETST